SYKRPVDNSVDEYFAEALDIGTSHPKPAWSFFVHKIKCTQNRQLQRAENCCTKWLFRDTRYQQIVHKHLAPRA
ncbi:TPA: hypothetical protein ACOQZT_004709, partial [Serratia odorifera]